MGQMRQKRLYWWHYL